MPITYFCLSPESSTHNLILNFTTSVPPEPQVFLGTHLLELGPLQLDPAPILFPHLLCLWRGLRAWEAVFTVPGTALHTSWVFNKYLAKEGKKQEEGKEGGGKEFLLQSVLHTTCYSF